MVTTAAIARPSPVWEMSPAAFRIFQETRPDEERWELVEGAPVMMSPALIIHNRIAGNLEHLLREALDRHDPTRIAVQRLGVELGNEGNYRPEPDVVVIDVDFTTGQRFANRVYLLAEILSGTDRRVRTRSGEPWVDVKRQIYLGHEPCEAVLMIEQTRIEARLDLRTAEGWSSQTLKDDAAELAIPSFGPLCQVGALYEGTPLKPRAVPS